MKGIWDVGVTCPGGQNVQVGLIQYLTQSQEETCAPFVTTANAQATAAATAATQSLTQQLLAAGASPTQVANVLSTATGTSASATGQTDWVALALLAGAAGLGIWVLHN